MFENGKEEEKILIKNACSVVIHRLHFGLDDKCEYGKVIATAELTDCILITQEFVDSITELEKTLGDYTIGRYAWKLENVNMLDEPIPAKGNQRLWEWKGEL